MRRSSQSPIIEAIGVLILRVNSYSQQGLTPKGKGTSTHSCERFVVNSDLRGDRQSDCTVAAQERESSLQSGCLACGRLRGKQFQALLICGLK